MPITIALTRDIGYTKRVRKLIDKHTEPMNEYLLNPDVCPSSLNDNDEPMDENDTAHRYEKEYDQAGDRIMKCTECGAEAEPMSAGRKVVLAIGLLNDYKANNPTLSTPEIDEALALIGSLTLGDLTN